MIEIELLPLGYKRIVKSGEAEASLPPRAVSLLDYRPAQASSFDVFFVGSEVLVLHGGEAAIRFEEMLVDVHVVVMFELPKRNFIARLVLHSKNELAILVLHSFVAEFEQLVRDGYRHPAIVARGTRLIDDLEQLVSEKRFRQDLFYRLNVAGYTIPPLRDRVEIIPRLAENFLKGLAERLGERRRTLTPGSIAALKRYSWPGNIRELENVLEKAAIFSPKSYISEVDLNLPEGNSKLAINPCNQAGALPLARQNLKELEREAIRQTLESVNGDKYQAAKFLGISVKSVYNKVKSLKLN